MVESCEKLDKAFEFFGEKLSSHPTYQECLKYIAANGLLFEVLVSAHNNLKPTATMQECVDEISDRMDDWDL
jgi:hypothetical protein